MVNVLRPLRSVWCQPCSSDSRTCVEVGSGQSSSERVWQVCSCVGEEVHTLDTDVDVVLLIVDLDFPACVFGFRERIEGLKVLDVCGHKTEQARGWCESGGLRVLV